MRSRTFRHDAEVAAILPDHPGYASVQRNMQHGRCVDEHISLSFMLDMRSKIERSEQHERIGVAGERRHASVLSRCRGATVDREDHDEV